MPVEAQVRGRRGRGRHPAAREPAGSRQGEHGGRDGRLAAELHQRTAEDGAEQDGGERPHLHERVAADQLVGVEVLRQDAVLDRPEDRRVRTHQEDDGEQERHAVQTEACGAEQHDPDLEQLHEPDDPRLVELVGDLSRARREEEEGQREQPGAQVDERVLGERHAAHPEREQDDERVLEQVVVQRPKELGPEEGPEPPSPEQPELTHPPARLISRCSSHSARKWRQAACQVPRCCAIKSSTAPRGCSRIVSLTPADHPVSSRCTWAS